MSNNLFTVHIRSHGRSVVQTDNFEFHKDEINFFFGESGIGKSMLSKAVYGLLDPEELDITINGQKYPEYLASSSAKAIKTNSFFVFQEPSSHLNSLLKISEQLGEGSLKHAVTENEILARLWQNSNDKSMKRILDIYPKPYRPSGGEKQRILLAMAFKKIEVFLQQKPQDISSFFVFDEPTGSLDNTYRNLFLELLFEQYCKNPFTIMIITHDYSIISEMFARYKPLVSKIHYKELRRCEGAKVEVADFSANEYLSWLEQSKTSHTPFPAGEQVLTVSSHFNVFGRKLCLYKDEGHTKPADLVIKKGEMVYVKAPSGVGKTTLAKVVMGLYQSQNVVMTLSGLSIAEKTPEKFFAKKIWGKKAGMVFQHADESLDLQSTVAETFAGLALKDIEKPEMLRKYFLELFEESTLTDAFFRKKVSRLSGGQKQRLNLLRTLCLHTDLIILDEPLNGLDFLSVKKVLNLLDAKREQGSALLMISHNEEIFDAFVDLEHTYYLSELH